MAYDAKTKSAPLDAADWLANVLPERRAEAERLLALFSSVTGWEPRLWGPSMVGFGRYEYRYDSGHSGEAMATGFSPRRAEISVYILPGCANFAEILSRLGPHKSAKSCVYIKRLDKVDIGVLEELIRAGLRDLATRWTVHPV